MMVYVMKVPIPAIYSLNPLVHPVMTEYTATERTFAVAGYALSMQEIPVLEVRNVTTSVMKEMIPVLILPELPVPMMQMNVPMISVTGPGPVYIPTTQHPATTDCSARTAISAVVEHAEGCPETAAGQEISVMMGFAMRQAIPAMHSQNLLVHPVMTECTVMERTFAVVGYALFITAIPVQVDLNVTTSVMK